jgi:hypothetical protein
MSSFNKLPIREILLGPPDEFPKIPKHLVFLSIIAIVLGAALGWGLVRLTETAFSAIEMKNADHHVHRPPPPPLPTSPFRKVR